jgi:hypothetical protein
MNSQEFLATQLTQAFQQASRKGDLPAQVRLARGTVTALILEGGIDADLVAPINRLAGGPFDPTRSTPAGDLWSNDTAHLDAAVAIGIAIGQLVHPDVFKKGGA